MHKKSYTITLTFTFTVSRNGAIAFDNKQEGANYIKEDIVRDVLAQEMYNVCIMQIADSLSGRSVSGISSELKWHYMGYQTPFINNPAEIANIGGSNEEQSGYDDNGSIFEFLSKFRGRLR